MKKWFSNNDSNVIDEIEPTVNIEVTGTCTMLVSEHYDYDNRDYHSRELVHKPSLYFKGACKFTLDKEYILEDLTMTLRPNIKFNSETEAYIELAKMDRGEIMDKCKDSIVSNIAWHLEYNEMELAKKKFEQNNKFEISLTVEAKEIDLLKKINE